MLWITEKGGKVEQKERVERRGWKGERENTSCMCNKHITYECSGRGLPTPFWWHWVLYLPIKGNLDHQLTGWAVVAGLLLLSQHVWYPRCSVWSGLIVVILSLLLPALSSLLPPSSLLNSHPPFTPGIPHAVRRGRRRELRARECCCVLHSYLTVTMWLSCDCHVIIRWHYELCRQTLCSFQYNGIAA